MDHRLDRVLDKIPKNKSLNVHHVWYSVCPFRVHLHLWFTYFGHTNVLTAGKKLVFVYWDQNVQTENKRIFSNEC